ncbi:MAG: Rieske 2Fe-2S domain-containing protein, partial [Chloroflexota bacterium]|nr:Rieske 2Fe-2S domain-containing protein [Chloroflexota bacterium]
MLSKEENELITASGPGTLMGNLLRQYWAPALLSSELPEPDCTPVRVLLLGEKLIAFRDSSGKVGLLDQACPHRGASLFFGRNEECGLRCVYHGWKFGVDGSCLDMPNEPAESSFKHKVKAKAYPCLERNGVVWAYMGSRETPPPLPDLEANMLAEGEWSVTAIQRECNWLQALEGDIDTSHFGFLHAGSVDAETQPLGTFSYYVLKDRAPRYTAIDTEGGAMYGAYRPADPGRQYWRVAQFIFPYYTMPPQGVLGLKVIARAWVPMDDRHIMFFNMSPAFRPRPVGAAGRPPAGGLGRMLPNSSDWLGRFRLMSNSRNDYDVDREKQRRNEEYTGITGIHLQDQAITESMGPVYDRTQEHLGTSDVMIIRVRRRLLAAARALAERGEVPPGVEQPSAYHVRAGGVLLPDGVD